MRLLYFNIKMLKKIFNYTNSLYLSDNARTLGIKKNVFYSFILKGGSGGLSLITVPITINYINTTQYGIWLTLSTLINWFAFFDIGLGNGLKNKLAESNSLGEYIKSKIYISTTYAIIAIVSTSIFILFLLFNRYINWNLILNVSTNEKIDLNRDALIIIGCFCAQFVIQLINIILTACHVPSKVNLITLISQGISLILIFILTKVTSGSLTYLIIVLAGIPVLIQLIATIWLFKTEYKQFAPSFKQVKFSYSKELLTLGGMFFIIQMGQLVLYQTDNIVITQLFGPKEVTTFNIAYKLFSTILILFTIIINPFWSAFTDAYVQKDIAWIRKIFFKMQKTWLIMVGFALLLLILSPLIFKLWLNHLVTVPFILSFSMTLYVIGSCWHMLCCYLLNGINKIRLQLYMYIICFFINIPISIFLGKAIGITGIVISNLIIFIGMGIIFYIQCNKILNNKAYGIWNK